MADWNIETFRGELERLREELLSSLQRANDLDKPVAPDRAIGRLTRQDALQSQQMALELKRQQKARLLQVEQALRRIEAGTYGVCLKCEERISVMRLKVRPEAHLCVRCAGGASPPR
jgi:DnaK suppressor protein